MTAPDPGAPRVEPTAVEGRRALVVGLGTFGGGLGAARWLAAHGARVTVTDLRDERVLASSVAALSGDGVRLVLGEHREEDFRQAELVVVNPAVPPASRWLGIARAAGASLTSEVALFLERVRGDVVAVTGTQGKSSTAHMTHQLLTHAGRRSHLGGNIGGSLLQALDAIEASDAVVLELSSYQLEAALARYCDRVAQGLFASLHAPDAGLPHIRGYLEGLASFVTAPSGSRACFVLNTLVELGGPAAQQFPVLRDHLDGLRAAFAAALTQARERGELPTTADLDAHADHLAIVAQAVLLQGRTGASPEALRHFLDLSLSTLES